MTTAMSRPRTKSVLITHHLGAAPSYAQPHCARAPLVHPAQGLGVGQRRQDRAPLLQRALHEVAREGDDVGADGARRRARAPRREQQLGQRRRVHQALQHAVHEAGVSEVLQARALRMCVEYDWMRFRTPRDTVEYVKVLAATHESRSSPPPHHFADGGPPGRQLRILRGRGDGTSHDSGCLEPGGF